MWIVNIALRRPYTFIVAALLVLFFAPFVLRKIPSDIFPEIDIPVVAALWSYGGMPAGEIADRFTATAERIYMQQVDEIEHIESQSLIGLSVIKIFFHPGTDLQNAVTQVMAASNSAMRTMPTGAQPPSIYQYSATDLPILQLGVSSKTVSEIELGDLAMNVVRSDLARIPGVAINYPFGSKNRQVSVDLDSNALLARNLAPRDVIDSISRGNLILPTGEIKLGTHAYPVTLNGALSDIASIGDIPVSTRNGATTYVRDVAQVRDGYALQTTVVRQDGGNGILLTVLKNGSASTVELVKNIRAALPALIDKLPEGVSINPMFDQSQFVDAAIDNVVHEGLIAAALTSALILLFLGNWRSTCIIALSIPLSILCSIIVLNALGQTLNLMTLGGLALAVGILVDDATVGIENVERHLAMGKPPLQAIFDGSAQIATPTLVSTLGICIVFVPLFFLSGITRSLFVPLAEAVIFAMLASWILSRTLVPTLLMLMHRKPGQEAVGPAWLAAVHTGFNRGFERFRRGYEVLLTAALTCRRRLFAAFGACLLLSLALVPMLGQDFFPEVDAGQLRLHVRAPAGTRLEEMPPLIERVEAAVRGIIPQQDVQTVLNIIGGPYSSRNTVFGNAGTVETADTEMLISLQPERSTSSREYAEALRAQLPLRFPDVEFFFQPADQVGQSLNFGTPAAIDVRIAGRNATMPLAAQIANELRAVPGAVDVRIYQRYNRPGLSLAMDRTQLEQLGLDARDVAENLLLTLSGSGQTEPSYWLDPANGSTYTVGVQARETSLDSLDDLLRTPVSGADGGEPQLLGNLVTMRRVAQPTVVSRYNGAPTLNIHAEVSGRDLGATGRDIEALVQKYRAQLPRGVSIEVSGQYRTMQDSYRGLLGGLLIATVLVYFLIVVNFQSWLDPLVILGALPGALAGIIWMLFLSGTTLSVPALTGAIMTIGVAVANSILVVSLARERLADGLAPAAAALDAGVTRLRPVLMTALAMIVGMMPMAFGMGAGGEQNAPLGRAVIGGLTFATLSTLLVVPALFSMVHERLARRAVHPISHPGLDVT